MIRPATQRDLDYLTRGFDQLQVLLRAEASGPFASELPQGEEASRPLAESFLQGGDAFALIVKADGGAEEGPDGCLAARIGLPSVGWSERLVGQVILCWVEPKARRKGLGRALNAAAEEEFRRRGATHAELAYLVGNADAETAWAKLGYEPHRVFSVKQLPAAPQLR